MIFKNGVYLKIQPEMAEGLPLIDAAYHDMAIDFECVVTSANDGRHMAGSLHYAGRAVDLRTRDLHPDTIGKLVLSLRRYRYSASSNSLASGAKMKMADNESPFLITNDGIPPFSLFGNCKHQLCSFLRLSLEIVQ